MKILKVLNNEIGNTRYTKYRINIPKKIAEKSKLLGKKVKVRFERKKIIIEEK